MFNTKRHLVVRKIININIYCARVLSTARPKTTCICMYPHVYGIHKTFMFMFYGRPFGKNVSNRIVFKRMFSPQGVNKDYKYSLYTYGCVCACACWPSSGAGKVPEEHPVRFCTWSK